MAKCWIFTKNKFQFIPTNAMMKFPVLTILKMEWDKVLMITEEKKHLLTGIWST